MKPFEAEAHKTKRAKMGCVTGSPENFESGADKAARFCRGGYADGGATPDMDRAKNYIRGMKVLGSGTWSGKDAFQHGAEDAKKASEYMRPNAKGE